MSRMMVFALPLAMLAGGCNRSQQASVGAEVQAQDAQIARHEDPNILKPGKWQTKQDILGVAKADLPAESKAEIRKSAAAMNQCITPEEARQPDANFFAGGDSSECKYDRFAMAKGRLDAALSCTITPGTMKMVMKGNYTPTSYALDATMTTSGTGGHAISTSARLTGMWLEPCPDPAHPQAPEVAQR